jgi:hypothetical protein
MFRLEFKTSNAAFGEDEAQEVARILHGVGDQVLLGVLGGPVYDLNGNRVGSFSLVAEED